MTGFRSDRGRGRREEYIAGKQGASGWSSSFAMEMMAGKGEDFMEPPATIGISILAEELSMSFYYGSLAVTQSAFLTEEEKLRATIC